MASDRQTADFILDQLDGLDVHVHPVFGEFALYCDERVVGFICDDELFIKPTNGNAGMADGRARGRPYPGAKEYLVVGGDRIENRDWLQELVLVTSRDVPPPRPKRSRRRM